jgi:dTDP-4-amino-4,6-dideoxygalactose transaminase
MPSPILLSPPHLGTEEWQFVQEAFASNWIAPVGPNIDAFEQEFAAAIGNNCTAAAVSSGTAAIHLALDLLGVTVGDEVFCSTFTFIASANPIVYCGAKPVFLDSDRTSWNLDPNVLEEALTKRDRFGQLPKAVIVVHLYGQSADMAAILELCDRYEIPVIEDAAEALGATYQGQAAGTLGRMGIYSFNGNKIITTSGGGMLVSQDPNLIHRAKFLATQARDAATHYQHSQIGYNYRMSNILAGVGRGQLRQLADRVEARRYNFAYYQQALQDLPGITWMPEAAFGRSNRWLSCCTIDPTQFGCDRDRVQAALAAAQIESRPVWKPLHLQPVFNDCDYFGGTVAVELFDQGLCLPSGSSLTIADRDRIIEIIRQCHCP